MDLRVTFCVAAALVLGDVAPALAQDLATGLAAKQPVASQDDPFSALVGKRRKRQRTEARRAKTQRYVLASDDRAFLFEDLGDEARLTFLCGERDRRLDCTLDEAAPSPEIYTLAAIRAPRGDIIYKNREGDTFLRIASYGGATVFWGGGRDGFAASKSYGDDAPLALPDADAAMVQRRAVKAAAVISAATGEAVVFDPGVVGEGAAELADAIVLTAKGVAAVADDSTGARVIGSRISAVKFISADEPGLALEEDALLVRYVPGLAVKGRPSSAAVARFLEDSL